MSWSLRRRGSTGRRPGRRIPISFRGALYEVELTEYETVVRLRFVKISQCADGIGWRFKSCGHRYLLGAGEFLVLTDLHTGADMLMGVE